jgi:GT2 family glycosyltransferase
MAPRVHIIVLHWGDRAVTALCLQSLARITCPNVEVVVIDNGTPDRGGETLERDFPQCHHIRSEANLGFAAGNNLGLRRALEAGADCALLLNNDTEVEPDFLEPLLAAVESDPAAGLVNPKILYADPAGTIWFSRGEHSLWTGLARCVDRHRADEPGDDATISMTFATGCALLIPCRVLHQIGLLDESLFMYSEDLDLSIRVRRAGLKILNVRSSRVVHHEKVQRRKTVSDPFRLHLTTRNTVLVERLHARPWHHLTFWPWFTLRWVALLSLKNLLRGFPRDAAAIWSGLWDGLRGRIGPPGSRP